MYFYLKKLKFRKLITVFTSEVPEKFVEYKGALNPNIFLKIKCHLCKGNKYFCKNRQMCNTPLCEENDEIFLCENCNLSYYSNDIIYIKDIEWYNYKTKYNSLRHSERRALKRPENDPKKIYFLTKQKYNSDGSLTYFSRHLRFSMDEKEDCEKDNKCYSKVVGKDKYKNTITGPGTCSFIKIETKIETKVTTTTKIVKNINRDYFLPEDNYNEILTGKKLSINTTEDLSIGCFEREFFIIKCNACGDLYCNNDYRCSW